MNIQTSSENLTLVIGGASNEVVIVHVLDADFLNGNVHLGRLTVFHADKCRKIILFLQI